MVIFFSTAPNSRHHSLRMSNRRRRHSWLIHKCAGVLMRCKARSLSRLGKPSRAIIWLPRRKCVIGRRFPKAEIVQSCNCHCPRQGACAALENICRVFPYNECSLCRYRNLLRGFLWSLGRQGKRWKNVRPRRGGRLNGNFRWNRAECSGFRLFPAAFRSGVR